jgi:hypothetical protein
MENSKRNKAEFVSIKVKETNKDSNKMSVHSEGRALEKAL